MNITLEHKQRWQSGGSYPGYAEFTFPVVTIKDKNYFMKTKKYMISQIWIKSVSNDPTRSFRLQFLVMRCYLSGSHFFCLTSSSWGFTQDEIRKNIHTDWPNLSRDDGKQKQSDDKLCSHIETHQTSDRNWIAILFNSLIRAFFFLRFVWTQLKQLDIFFFLGDSTCET